MNEGGVLKSTKIAPNQGKRFSIVTCDLSPDANLSALAKLVNGADTPHRDEVKPGLMVELLADLGDKKPDTVQKMLGSVDGIDGANSRVFAKRGVIAVKLSGGPKLTLDDILTSLDKAGIKARLAEIPAKAAPAADADKPKDA